MIDPADDDWAWVVLTRGANAERSRCAMSTAERVRTVLAFDHSDILATAMTRLRNRVEYISLPVHLRPTKLTLPDLQRVYEQTFDRRMDKSAFRKKNAHAEFLEPIPGERRPASNRSAQVYRITRAARLSSSTE